MRALRSRACLYRFEEDHHSGLFIWERAVLVVPWQRKGGADASEPRDRVWNIRQITVLCCRGDGLRGLVRESNCKITSANCEAVLSVSHYLSSEAQETKVIYRALVAPSRSYILS